MRNKSLILIPFLVLNFFIPAYCFELTSHSASQIVDEEIAEAMKKTGSPGIAVALFDGKRAYTLSYGYANATKQTPITEDTIFEIGSVTKVFTTTALAWEVLNGKMKLNDPITEYLNIKNSNGDISHVRLVDLATHTSSLPRDIPNPYELNAVLNFLSNWKAEYPISTRYVYSNAGFGILGLALANVEKESYFKVIDQIILDPLNMHSTFMVVPQNYEQNYAVGYTPNDQIARRLQPSVLGAGGHLRSTSADMLKFLLANMGLEGPKELINAMKFAQKGNFKVSDDFTLALGWQLKTEDGIFFIDKNGGVPGFSTYIGFLPKHNIGVVLLFNKAKADATSWGRKLLRRLANSNGSYPQPQQ
jgi:beta-lactamase class C